MSFSPSRAHRRYGAIGVVGAIAVALKFAAVAGAAGMIWIHLCGSWTPGQGATGGSIGVAHSGSSSPGISTPYQCPEGGSSHGMEVLGHGSGVPSGARAFWQINTPPGLSIVGVHTEGSGMATYGVNANVGWGGGFYWKGGGAPAHPGQIAYSSPAIDSPYFGWQLICASSKCDGATKPGEITVLGLELEAAENSGPSVLPAPGGLGATAGWVRGWWPVAFFADGPSGACQLAATLGGLSVSQPVNEPQTQLTWHQCPTALFSQSFDTASVGSGPSVPLVMWARDAAYDYQARTYLSSTVTRYIRVDNAPVTVSLSGPTDAASTAGVQHVDVTATAGPSGVSSIACSLDGAPPQSYPNGAQIPVQGIGTHHLSCTAFNGARNTAGELGASTPDAWTLSIRQPSVSTVSFDRVIDALRCAKSRERVRVPARWVTARHHGHPVRVRLPAETRTVTVVHCHPRIVRRRVRVHGRWRTKRFVLLPRTVAETTRRVRHGASTTIDGWLGTTQGNALGGQRVRILTAPDNGDGGFAQAAVAITGPDGAWTARVPPGPSRIVQAVYDGTAAVEPSSSAPAEIVVPASVAMQITPHQTHWGGKITISGRLRGGYIPPAGELVVLWIGWPGGSTEIGHLYAGRDGRFRSTYTFLRGNGVERYRLWAATATETDYPYATARSRRTGVTVGS